MSVTGTGYGKHHKCQYSKKPALKFTAQKGIYKMNKAHEDERQ